MMMTLLELNHLSTPYHHTVVNIKSLSTLNNLMVVIDIYSYIISSDPRWKVLKTEELADMWQIYLWLVHYENLLRNGETVTVKI